MNIAAIMDEEHKELLDPTGDSVGVQVAEPSLDHFPEEEEKQGPMLQVDPCEEDDEAERINQGLAVFCN